MSQILLRRLSSHPCGARGCLRLGPWAAAAAAAAGPRFYAGGGERRRGGPAHDDEGGRAVRVSVWWDFENCNLPNGVNVCRVAPRVAAALRAAGIRGPLSITAFGDVLQLSRAAQEDLSATGVSISHVPRSGKNSSDRSFMADLVYWTAQNPPPVHLFLISGDKDFANILHRLRMSNYNILLACPSSATSVLCSAATFMWPWEALVKGEDFLPKRFNHPPDGLSGSWYGQYKGALDDPFCEIESEEPIKVPSDSNHHPAPSDSKHSSIPKYVTRGILNTLSSYPKGMRLSDLRLELKKNNISLNTDFFGHKKFSCLLQSMSDIVEFLDPPPGENQPYVTLVNKSLSKPVEQKTLSSAQCDAKENNPTQTAHDDKSYLSHMSGYQSELNSEHLSSSQTIDGNRSSSETVNENQPTFAVSSSPSDVLSEDQKERLTAYTNAQPESAANHREVDERNTLENPSSSELENGGKKDGLFKRIWILWNGSENAKSEVSQNCEGNSAKVVDDLQTPLQEHNTDQRRKLLKRIRKTSPTNVRSDGTDSTAAVSASLSVLSDDVCSENIKKDPSILGKSEPCSGSAALPRGKAEKNYDTFVMNKGLLSWAAKWWSFGKSDSDNGTTNNNVTDEARTEAVEGSKSLEESKSSISSNSGSRLQAVNDIFTKPHLWDVLEKQLSKPQGSELVSKAKTREELVHGLRKLGCWALKDLLEKDLHQLVNLLVSEKKWIEENPTRLFPYRLTLPHKRTCVPSNSSKYNGLSSIFSSGKTLQQVKHDDTSRPLTREEILSDCHKLLTELLSRYEYGFNISIFKRNFSQKHGYELDHQKLGYPDLESLLRIMPGTRIKYPRVLPTENGNDQAGSKGNENVSNGDDFIWEELGPVSASAESAAGIDKEMCYNPPSPSDDEFSDNDNHAGQQPRRGAEQSSLLQIIDSWNSSKGDGSIKKPEVIDGLVDCARSNPGYLDNLAKGNAQRPTRLSHKQYTFVSDSEEDKEKDKLVESVLGSLQKARGPKLHN